MARGDRRWLLTLGVIIACVLPVFLPGGQKAGAQGMGVAGQAGGSVDAGAGEPRGSAITSGTSGGGGDRGAGFGGITGGRNEQSGTIGTSTRGVLQGSPGDPDRHRLGRPLGASGTAELEQAPGAQGTPVGGRVGVMGNRIPAGAFQPPRGRQDPASGIHDRLARERMQVEPPESDPISLSPHPRLELPAAPEDPGPDSGMTLDAAIETLLKSNLNLIALRYEIPKADADILTAGLRTNPIIYGDAQLIPYGHYTNERPGGGGGQPQYDVNVTYPLDLSRKRRARIEVAQGARRVTEAQLQDAVRNLIDDLYSTYVNVLAARETLRYNEAFLAGILAIYERAEREGREKEAASRRAEDDPKLDPADKERIAAEAGSAGEAVVLLRDQVQQGRFQARRSSQTLIATKRTLAQLLNLPEPQSESLQLRARLREIPSLPAMPDVLVETAINSRPDLIAYRLGLHRAQADVRLARANRFSDVYLVYQPYTLQGNRAFGLKGTYSYAVGVNAALPIYNRNQGNIARAEWNVRQTGVDVAAMERQVVDEVRETFREVQLGQAGLRELEQEVLPASRRARDLMFTQYRKDPEKLNDYLDQQENYNGVVLQYRNALIELRQDILRLNTVVGVRLFP